MTRETFIIKEVLRYVQMPYDQADEALKEQILQYYKQIETVASPRWCYKVFPIIKEDNCVQFEGTTLTIKSFDIQRLLKHSDTCYLLAATLGVEADRLIQEAQTRHMGDALFLNACANVLIEEVCDQVEQEIIGVIPEDKYMTMRYSPGYGDVDLGVQDKLIDILGTGRQIGLTLSKSGMLLPLKSITAFIGISSKKESRVKSCSACMMQANCIYRKRGDVCGC